jgi:hypothetical protein
LAPVWDARCSSCDARQRDGGEDCAPRGQMFGEQASCLSAGRCCGAGLLLSDPLGLCLSHRANRLRSLCRHWTCPLLRLSGFRGEAGERGSTLRARTNRAHSAQFSAYAFQVLGLRQPCVGRLASHRFATRTGEPSSRNMNGIPCGRPRSNDHRSAASIEPSRSQRPSTAASTKNALVKPPSYAPARTRPATSRSSTLSSSSASWSVLLSAREERRKRECP